MASEERYALERSEDPMGGAVYTLRDRAAGISASAAPQRGFLWSSLCLESPKLGSVELLYRGGDFSTALKDGGMSPVLFPAVGRLQRGEEAGVYVHDGQRYEMDIHGFAKDVEWRSVEASANGQGAFVRAYLTEGMHTRRSYPFAFEYALTYRLFEGTLHIQVEIESQGPFSVGFHPYFNTPFVSGRGTKADCAMRIPAQSHWVLKDLVPTGHREKLDRAYHRPEGVSCAGLDLDEVFTDLVTDPEDTHRSSLWDRVSGIRIDIESTADPFSEIVVYAPADKPFVCIENWTDPPNVFNREDTWSGRCPSALQASIQIRPGLIGGHAG